MPVSDAKKRSNRRWDAENVKRISLCVKLDYAGAIAARAEALGKPVNRYILDLVRADMEAAKKS